MAKSVQVWLSDEANVSMLKELEILNRGLSNRRGDKIFTKAQKCSEIIDKHYGIRKK